MSTINMKCFFLLKFTTVYYKQDMIKNINLSTQQQEKHMFLLHFYYVIFIIEITYKIRCIDNL